MNGTMPDLENELKKARTMRTLRIVWMILIPLFAAIILWRLHNYANGEDDLSRILLPLGTILIGVSSILDVHYKILKSVLIGAAMILVVTGLIFVFL